MREFVLLDGGSRMYKGNLHTHSTRSDGQYEPETVIAAYRNKGYDFLCLSDHEIYFKSEAYDDGNFIMIGGYEMACEMSREETGQQYHLHGLLDRFVEPIGEFEHNEEHAKPDYENLNTIQTLIDDMRARGNLVILNHPEWSKNKPTDLLALQGYTAIEIYNHQSELDEAAGCGIAYWDYLLRHGRRIHAIASDDAHGGAIDAVESEFFGGWVEVQADKLEGQSVVDALRKGRYYSSNGPKILDLRVRDGRLEIECSPVKRIKFLAHPGNGHMVYDPGGEPVSHGSFPLRGGEGYVRVECIGFDGSTAWSNAVFPADLFLP
ncbi:PHP domain-containing protein [Saccharibacillus qingshengii]|uniref:PHP domain-containing protein n=1 Tax=Saccharibacillus qingshengii TaxID=1763540 RepID=UPI001552BF14|nr:CehA/McbA family metallohydrolase [Saccharibacillus qingshengii]